MWLHHFKEVIRKVEIVRETAVVCSQPEVQYTHTHTHTDLHTHHHEASAGALWGLRELKMGEGWTGGRGENI